MSPPGVYGRVEARNIRVGLSPSGSLYDDAAVGMTGESVLRYVERMEGTCYSDDSIVPVDWAPQFPRHRVTLGVLKEVAKRVRFYAYDPNELKPTVPTP